MRPAAKRGPSGLASYKPKSVLGPTKLHKTRPRSRKLGLVAFRLASLFDFLKLFFSSRCRERECLPTDTHRNEIGHVPTELIAKNKILDSSLQRMIGI